MIRCAKCNGFNIEQLAWIDPNDRVVLDIAFDEDQSVGNNWCRDCEEHVNFIYDDEIPSNLR